MSGPVHMNQVIFQTPNVEKVQQAEHQSPDMTQRHASVEELDTMRQKNETVQTTKEAEDSRPTETEERERRESRKGKRQPEAEPDEEAAAQADEAPREQGRIVDVVV